MTHQQAIGILEERLGMEVAHIQYIVPEGEGYRIGVEMVDGSIGDEIV